MKILCKIFISLSIAWASNVTLCFQELALVFKSAPNSFETDPDRYSKMFTYTGKSLNDLGRYDDCEALSDTKYTLIEIIRHPFVGYSVCGPSICSEENYIEIINDAINSFFNTDPIKQSLFLPGTLRETIKNTSAVIHFPHTYVEKHFKITAGATFMILFCVFIGLIGITGTAIDIIQSVKEEENELGSEYSELRDLNDKSPINVKRKKSRIREFLLNFSAKRNAKILMKANDDENLKFFDFVRWVSVCWLIVATVAYYFFNNSVLANVMKLEQLLDKDENIVFFSGLYSLDTLFWISGFTFTLFLLYFCEGDHKYYFKAIFSEYALKAPIFLSATLFFWSLQKYIGQGPLWYQGNEINDECNDYWWSNAIYVNNFVPDFKFTRCLSNGYYLACEMQFFIITLPIVWIYKKSYKIAWLFISVLSAIGVTSAAIIASHYNLNVVVLAENYHDYFDYYFSKPYCRVPSYAFGIGGAFIYYTKCNYQKRDRIAEQIIKYFENRYIRWGAVLFGLFLWTFIIDIQYSAYKDDDYQFDNWTQGQNVAYIASCKVVNATGISLMGLPLILGHFTYFRYPMSLQMWAPLGKLTYCAYLIHLNIIDIIMKSQKSSLYLQKLNIYWYSIALIGIVYIFAVPFALFVEIPLYNFLSYKLKSKPIKKKQSKKANTTNLKILVLGNSKVGKTSLLNQYINKKFDLDQDETDYAELFIKDVVLDGNSICLNIWDIPGHQRYLSFELAFYRDTDCCVIVYDINSDKSFQAIKDWKEEFLNVAKPEFPEEFPFIIIGNKIDVEHRDVSYDDALEWCKGDGEMNLFEVSAKEATNIEKVFQVISEKALHHMEKQLKTSLNSNQ
ncbi:unnamed protein product [Blepharisma stoltei]|uniref:Acyltransferase 3 domain-containing protein n=1 Tax=Blepharisma stoltei TaxID=1481888 RepID=A0AAU9KJ41_9CILI|nr:unnamed protein product [Blepharisma stoltei]